MGEKIIIVNARGFRIGESHPRAKLSDSDVEQIRNMGAERDDKGRRIFGRRRIAKKMGVSTWTIRSILDGVRRIQKADSCRMIIIDSGSAPVAKKGMKRDR